MQHRFFVVKKKTSSSKFPAVSMARLARENHFTLVEFIYFNIEYCQLRMLNYRWYFLLLLTCSADFVSSWTFRWTHHCHHWNYCRNRLQVVRAKEDENSLSLSFTHLMFELFDVCQVKISPDQLILSPLTYRTHIRDVKSQSYKWALLDS